MAILRYHIWNIEILYRDYCHIICGLLRYNIWTIKILYLDYWDIICGLLGHYIGTIKILYLDLRYHMWTIENLNISQREILYLLCWDIKIKYFQVCLFVNGTVEILRYYILRYYICTVEILRNYMCLLFVGGTIERWVGESNICFTCFHTHISWDCSFLQEIKNPL